MKPPTDLQKVVAQMQPGCLTRDGMLGNDLRTLQQILDADQAIVSRLGLTHADIARRLRGLTAIARRQLGNSVVIEDAFEVRLEEARGLMPCPFGHPRRYLKNVTFLRRLRTGEALQWSALGVHMIDRHGFYQGEGSPFRLDPEEIVRLLDIRPQ
jgi:hypothetical protein